MSQSYARNMQPFVDRLAGHSVLTNQEQGALLDLPVHAAQVQANRDFVGLGERVDHACLISDGIVGRFGQNAEGSRQITSFYIAGDMPDLYSVVKPLSGSGFQALSTATILRVPHTALRKLAARFPAIAEAFWRDCTVDVSIVHEWVVNVGRRDAASRMSHLLCEMATRYGSEGVAAMQFRLAVTQNHLADALGMTPVHINRTLKYLRDKLLVTMTRQVVEIVNWAGLAKLGDFDPAYLSLGPGPEQRMRLTSVN